MIAAACLALLAAAQGAAQGAGEPIDAVRTALAEGRYGDAWRALPDVSDPLLAARAEADLWYFARDFRACLAVVGRALEGAPDDLFLLHRGLNAALWLRDGARAVALSRRLGDALERAQLDADARAWWDAELAALRAPAAELVAAAAERDRRRARARAAALFLLAVSGAAAGLLARSAPPGTRPAPAHG